MPRKQGENVSPTAYATGYFWYQHGLSHPALATPQGKLLDRAFGVLIKGTQSLSGVSLQAMMLARHRGLDAVLDAAIDSGHVSQVIELAAGLSPRGWRVARKYGARVHYVETDLPQMTALKCRLLGDAGLLTPQHQVVELDALKTAGPQSLAAVAKALDPMRGTAIITEGLMNYLPPDAAKNLWRRIARTLSRFPQGQYLSDFYLTQENRGAATLAFGAILSTFVRGRMHVHFHSADQAARAMQSFGFSTVDIRRTADIDAIRDLGSQPGADRVRILQAAVSHRTPSPAARHHRSAFSGRR